MKTGFVPKVLGAVVLIVVILITVINCQRGDSASNPENPTIEAGQTAEYRGRESCRECHEKEYNLFLGSDHDMAMDLTTPETVLGDFNNATFTHFGITSRFYMSDGKYYVNTEGPEGEMEDYEVSYVFGIRPLQQYLIEFPGGRYQCLPICWDTRPADQGGQRWFHIYQDERIPPGDILHWTRVTQNWNYMCAECHSTNLRKNYVYNEKAYHTTWSEIDVSCEACHGPGSEHIDWAERVEKGSSPDIYPDMGLVVRLNDTDNATWVFDLDSITARRSVPRQSDELVQMCSRCHARRAVATEDYYHGGSLLDTHWPSLLEEDLYFADGQIQEEVYVYASFLQSKMYQAGVVCKDCHESHSGKVFVQGNALCYRCHMATEYGSRKHHFHDPAKEGASCFECHMHERTYMVVDPRRDHSIRIPRPDLSDKLGTPNACNQCHDDKSTQWATGYLREWYGDDLLDQEHYGEVFWAGRQRYPEAHAGLIRLGSDREQAPMIRATAILLLGNYPDQATTELLRRTVNDPDPLIRYATLTVAQSGESEFIRDLAVPRLKDSIKLVRLMAASSLTAVPRNLIPSSSSEALNAALEEYNASLMINADHPSTHLNFGNLYLNTGDYEKAEASYREAIEIEPGLVGPYINLADLYRRLNKDDEGEKALKSALKKYPDLAPIHYSLGLLKVRQGDQEEALTYLEKAAINDPADPHYSYVYAIGLNSQQKPGEALNILEAALEDHPYDRNILYSLATISMENGKNEDALKYAQKLVKHYPDDANYQQLLSILSN
ncbi:MAG: tetratricopeptide repeat protein [Bacteroidales bacterium]|nr:tetratricopeptide repeat protein [Bacteroidales bacterium]